MRARDVVGRTIVGVKHVRWWNAHTDTLETTCDCIILDNGRVIYAVTIETEGETVADLRLTR